ncbi:hypothetical protein GF373_17620 [bacterium]|nr:hypothetical protein [bacterium]
MDTERKRVCPECGHEIEHEKNVPCPECGTQMTGVEQKSPELPSPKGTEAKNNFVSRCVKWVMENDEAEDQDQALGMCYSQWENAKETKEASLEDQLDDVYDAWYDAERERTTEPKEPEVRPGAGQLLKVFDNYAIVHQDGKYYKFSYTRSEEGDVEFGDPIELEFTPIEEKAKWSTAYVNDLPDAAFLYIEPDGEKDDKGKTKSRSLRHLPYKDKDGAIDLPHLRNAISRLGQSDTGEDWEGFTEDKRESLQNRAQKMLEEETKSLNFVLEEKSYESGVVGYDLTVTDPESDIVLWSLTLGDSPLEEKEILGYDTVEKSTKYQITTIDKGSCIIESVDENYRQYDFRGEALRGLWSFNRDGGWTMTKDRKMKDVWDKLEAFVEGILGSPQEKSGFFVTKDAKTGRPRWTAISSTAFVDRENQIVSREGIRKSIERADQNKTYGDLTYWHTPIKLGECDYQAQHGVCLVESGLFDDTPVGRAAAKSLSGPVGEKWGTSIEFLPLKSIEDVVIKGRHVDTIWQDFQIIRRSPVPQEFAAANHTRIYVKGARMNEAKAQALQELLGPDLAASVLESVEHIDKETADPEAVFKSAEIKETISGVAENIEDEDIQARVKAVAENFEGDKDAAVKDLTEIFEDTEGPTAKSIAEVANDLGGELEVEVETEEPEEDVTAEVLKELTEKVAQLEGVVKDMQDAPRVTKSQFRASESDDTGLDKEDLKTKGRPEDEVPAVVRQMAAAGFGVKSN